MAEMPLPEHDNMVQAIASDRTDRPFTISILPRRSRRGRPIPNAHRPKAADEDVTVDGVAVTDDVSRRSSPTIGLDELARNPFSRIAYLLLFSHALIQRTELKRGRPDFSLAFRGCVEPRRECEKLIRLFVFGCCHLLSRWCVTTKIPCRIKYGWTNLSGFSIAQRGQGC
jgi:hypothetical protein